MGLTQSSIQEEEELSLEVKRLDTIKFFLQGSEHSVKTENINPSTSLNEYVRNHLKLTGTKGMCYEGGCGSCVVVLQNTDPISRKDVYLSVNSCLVPLLSCNGWRIFTIEGIGNPLSGYHSIQEVLAKFNGTQCGFCSPGMVMNMYALYQSEKLTMEQVENSFSGNLCRCTGYRPILSAFKSLCTDASREILGECPDIEDLKVCQKECQEKSCGSCLIEEPFCLTLADSKWIKVHTLKDLLVTLALYYNFSTKLVAGNTAQGVYKTYGKKVDVYIDVMDIDELKVYEIKADSCIVGANTTLTNAIEFFNEVAKNRNDFAYLKALADHIDLVANVPVRNRGTIAGNLMIKHDHRDFPSDIFLILETVNAKLTVVNLVGVETILSPLQFLNYNMSKNVLKTITLSPYQNSVKYVSYKIMPRAQNTHAHVNSGFLFKFDHNNLITSATIVFGNINNDFVHATKTEKFLSGRNLFDNNTLQQAYATLAKELTPDLRPPDPSPEFRKQLAVALFYKAVLSIAPGEKVSPKNKSGGELLKRPISTGVQDYETNKSMYPVTKAIPKLEALAQTSGQAQYIDDFPDLPYQLYGALVLAEAPPNSTVTNIDATAALKAEGVVAFFAKDDIPGDNNFTPLRPLIVNANEEIFCSGKVLYYEQPVGILVGTSQDAVDDAITLVQISYESPNVEPLLTARQVIKAGRTDRINEYQVIKPSRKGTNIKHVVSGTFDIYHQYHFHMETQCCNVVPNENGLDIFPSSQWMDLVQDAVAKMLQLQNSQISVKVRRCGGAFGGKITRNNLVSCAAALAAWKLKKPVRIRLPLTTNMTALGKRFPLSTDYEVGVDDKGVIQYLNAKHYTDVGWIANETISVYFEKIFLNTYTSDTFEVHFNQVTTDTHTNTWTRAPGSAEGLASLETIMEHISYATNIDPLTLRLANLPNESPLSKYISDIKLWATIDQRKSDIENFNKQNRWKKKGIAIIPMNFEIVPLGPYTTTVSVFHGDGSVQISHAGVEIGQGINTKAAQVCAYKFQIPLEKVTVIPSMNFASPNTFPTGGSLNSDAVCYGVIQACDEILKRLKPYQSDGAKWEDVINKAYLQQVKLIASGNFSPIADSSIQTYSVYGICATEVLVDILTGQHLVLRVDLIEDTGTSLSPVIDIGQAEGAFIMGLGYYTLEKVVFNYEGKILTNRTWNYWPPGAKDIPVDFRVKFPKNNPNPVGILGSKGTGEPAFCVAISVPLAIRNAVASARTDAGANSKWYRIDGTTDVENVFMNSLNTYTQYIL